MADDDLSSLIEHASQGDGLAVDQLLERYSPGLKAFIRLRTGKVLRGKESASDIVQSVCREVLQHMDRFQYRGEAGFKNWLYTTALRKIANRNEFYHAARRDVGREVSPQAGSQDDVRLLDCYRSFCTPSRFAMAKEELERIESAFEALPDHHREVIVLSRIVGLSHAEISAQMGKTEAATRTLLSRALAQLAEVLDDGTSSD
jgi:RNA polymerase sigma-70 factor (ECF subfamily)